MNASLSDLSVIEYPDKKIVGCLGARRAKKKAEYGDRGDHDDSPQGHDIILGSRQHGCRKDSGRRVTPSAGTPSRRMISTGLAMSRRALRKPYRETWGAKPSGTLIDRSPTAWLDHPSTGRGD